MTLSEALPETLPPSVTKSSHLAMKLHKALDEYMRLKKEHAITGAALAAAECTLKEAYKRMSQKVDFAFSQEPDDLARESETAQGPDGTISAK